MDIDKAKDLLLEIMEIVEERHGDCETCPFPKIVEGTTRRCPFDGCPELWEIEV